MSNMKTTIAKGGQTAGTLTGINIVAMATILICRRLGIEITIEEAMTYLAAANVILGAVGRIGGQIIKYRIADKEAK
jgi:hypothetical protein